MSDVNKDLQDSFLLLLNDYLRGDTPFLLPILDEYVEPLKSYAIYQESSPCKERAQWIISLVSEELPQLCTLKGKLFYQAFKILVLLKIFKEDENLLLLRHNIVPDFSEALLQEGVNLNSSFSQADIKDRIDLSHLFTWTMDSEDTQDFDDAISMEKEGDNFIVYIHISDVAHYILKDTPLDQEAQNRHRTLYLIQENILMLPSLLSHDILALKAKKTSLTITYRFVFSSSFQMTSYRIFPSIIYVDQNYSYESVDQLSMQRVQPLLPFFSDLSRICCALQSQRLNVGGGLDIILPNYKPKIQDHRIILKEYNPQKGSAFIIRELMILTNYITAQFLEQSKFPAIYHSQQGSHMNQHFFSRCITSQKEFFQLGGRLSHTFMTTENHGHCALGVSAYTQVTSPIRRYMDVVMQRQLKQALINQPTFYTTEDLEMIILDQKNKKSIANQLETERNKYFLFQYVEENRSKIWDGYIFKLLNSKEYLVEIHPLGIHCKVRGEQDYHLWDKVKVQFYSIYPRLNVALGKIFE